MGHTVLAGVLIGVLGLAGCAPADPSDNDTGCRVAERVLDLAPGPGSSFPSPLTIMDQVVYFGAWEAQHGRELWRFTPGDGAILVADIAAGSDSSSPGRDGMITVNDTLYFVADDGVHGSELWQYDVHHGASMVTDLRPGESGSGIDTLTAMGGTLYFTANIGDGRDLWEYDPPASALTRIPIKAAPETGSFSLFGYRSLQVYQDRLVFAASDGIYGLELWSYAPDTGPLMLADIQPGSDNSFPRHLTAVNERLYLAADDGVNGEALWLFTPDTGATLLADFDPDNRYGDRLANFIAMDDSLYFTTFSEGYGTELWQHHPDTGISLVADTVPGRGGFDDDEPPAPSHFRVLDGKLYFEAYDQISLENTTTWVHDPDTGTHPLAEFWPGSGIASVPRELVTLNTRLYFTYNDGISGQELWVINPDCTR